MGKAEIVTPELLQKALQRVLAGESANAVARSLNIHPGTLGGRLRQLPDYVEHQSKATLNTDLSCPECTGVMQKQELYFWKCSCGAEFWPSEDSIPDNPDEWLNTPLVNVSGQSDAMTLIRILHSDGKNAVEIAVELNAAGHTTARGVAWNAKNLLTYMRRHGVTSGDYVGQRERILSIVESMAGRQGISCADIANRLNGEGYRTNRNQPWSMASVQKIVRTSLQLDVTLTGTKALAVKRETTGKTGREHPWSKADTARINYNRKRFGKE